jgi:hypothetical protein
MAGARSSAAVVMAFLAILAILPAFPAASQPADKMDIYIKELAAEQRTRLVENYLNSGFVYSKFLKFQRPAAVYLSCADKACDPAPLGMLDDLRAKAPLALGERVGEADVAQIEIYVAPQPSAYEARDREIDREFHTDANYSGRNLSPPPDPLPASCWTATHFDLHTGVIAKSLIFIDSDASPRIQTLCMGFELVRAAGMVNTEAVLFYQKLDADLGNVTIWFAANAYLHGLPEIRPGGRMEEARAALNARYGLKITSP